MKIFIKGAILLACFSFQIQAFSQLKLDDIKLELIHQKKIREYIKLQIENNKHRFCEIHPSWCEGTDLSNYSKNEKTYLLNDELQKVWSGYLSANPSKSWNGRKVSFGLLLKKYPENIFYQNDSISGVDTGQVFYLNLRLIDGICNVPVAFEVVKIDNNNKIFEFSYIEGNKSTGMQRLEFFDIGNGITKIIHTSFFKSDSEFRDKWLYPYFHKKIINEFHKNMRTLLNS